MLSAVEQQKIEQMLQENEDLSAQKPTIEKYLADKSIKPEDYDKYLTSNSFELLVKDTKEGFAIIFGLFIIGAIVSALGLGFLVVIVLAIFALYFLFTFFKQICVFIAIQFGLLFLHYERILDEDIYVIIAVLIGIVFLPYLRFTINQIRKDKIEHLYYITEKIDENHQSIINFIKSPILSIVHRDIMVDVGSLHDKGFDVVPMQYLEEILDNEVGKGNIERLYLSQKNINLYKSKLATIDNQDNMESTVLEID